MREEDFPENIKAEALKRAGYRCERCWSERDLESHHRVPLALGGGADVANCVVLCPECHQIAPNDPQLIELFLKFASTKEMVQYYGVHSSKQAIERWCEEKGYLKEEIIERIDKNYPSRRDLIYERMKNKVMERGKPVGFPSPYGYTYKDGNLITQPEEAKIVRLIFDRYLGGGTIGKIVNELTSRAIPTKSGRKTWFKKVVASILRNPIYCGYIEWDRIVVKGTHEPIVSVDEFNVVQTNLAKRIRNSHQWYLPRLISGDQ